MIFFFLINLCSSAFQALTQDKYEVRPCVSEAAILVCSTTTPQLSLKVTLSSLAVREEPGVRRREGTVTPHPTTTPTTHPGVPSCLIDGGGV